MNVRERLQRITKEANDVGRVASCSDNDAAALRELDQLLLAFVVLNTIQCEDWADQNAQLIERAAQAGYGEK